MAKARSRRSPKAPIDGTASGGGPAAMNGVPAEAGVAPDELDLHGSVAHQPEGQQFGGHAPGNEDAHGPTGLAGDRSQWPSSGPGTWEGDGTGVWDPVPEWVDEDQLQNWDDEGGWDNGVEPTTWEAPGEGIEDQTWVDPRWSGEYETGYATSYVRSRDEALAAYEEYGTSDLDTEWAGDDGRPRERSRRRGNGPWPELVMLTAVAVIVAAVILAVTSADRNNGAGSQAAPTLPAVTAQKTHAPPAVASASGKSHHASSPAASTSTPRVATSTSLASKAAKSHAVGTAKNLLLTPGVAQSLVKSWLATNPGGVDIVAKDVAGTVPHQLYYGVQPASATYWAIAVFKPSAALLAGSSTAAGQAKLAEFQNSVYVFSWKAGPVWTLLGEVSAGSCPSSWVPTTVLAAWGLCGL